MNTTMEQPTTVTTIANTYNIRPSTDHSRFRITIPAQLMRELDISGGDRLGFQPTIDTNGHVVLRYMPAEFAPPEQMTVAVSQYSTSGVSRVPSATGQALELTDNELEWSVVEERPHEALDVNALIDDDDDVTPDEFRVPVLEAALDHVVEQVVPKSALPMSREPIEQKVQEDVSYNDKSWTQEQFRYYLSPAEMEKLGWNSGEEVAVSIKRRGNRPALTFTPIDDAENTNLTKTVNSTGTNGDGLLYISRDIVRSLGFVGQPLMWVNDDGRLVATKTGRNR